ncbi:hypothetical protein [Pseudomonas brenneri]|uniref:hypothetical protein n=1 Tax=Pseudomonas brenneri TaxID=129817 RepID=UPI0028D3525A|nr:hypothetical protein [Pseudomonas brenneri]
MKNISDMSLAEVTLAILKAAVNIPDGMYARAQFLASQELRALLNAPVPFPGYPPVPEDRKLPSAQPQGEPVAWQYRVSAGPQTGWSLWHDGKGEEFKRSYQVETRPLYAEQPAPVAVEYKIHMGEALKVFDALKVERIARKVEQEDLGPMGATEVETWSTSIGVTLEMHTAMGGCTLIVRTATVAVVMPEREAMRDIIAQAIGGDAYDCTRVWSAWGVGTMSDDDFIPIADQEERLYEIADACLDAVTRLNPSL